MPSERALTGASWLLRLRRNSNSAPVDDATGSLNLNSEHPTQQERLMSCASSSGCWPEPVEHDAENAGTESVIPVLAFGAETGCGQ